MFNDQELEKTYIVKCKEIFEENMKVHHDICDVEFALNKHGITTECHWVLEDGSLGWEPWNGPTFRLVYTPSGGSERPLNECSNHIKAQAMKHLPAFIESIAEGLKNV